VFFNKLAELPERKERPAQAARENTARCRPVQAPPQPDRRRPWSSLRSTGGADRQFKAIRPEPHHAWIEATGCLPSERGPAELDSMESHEGRWWSALLPARAVPRLRTPSAATAQAALVARRCAGWRCVAHRRPLVRARRSLPFMRTRMLSQLCRASLRREAPRACESRRGEVWSNRP